MRPIFDTLEPRQLMSITLAQSVSFGPQATNWMMARSVNQFDPALGTLLSVEVQENSTITSTMRAENTSTSSPATLTANLAGNIGVSALDVSMTAAVDQIVGTFNATTFDGTRDSGGTSGVNFGTNSGTGASDTLFTSGSALSDYTGTGTVPITAAATAMSKVTGSSNLFTSVQTTATAMVTVIYSYKANASIATTASAGGAVGTGVYDTATLSRGFNETGNITFKLLNSSNVAVFTDTKAANGNGSVSSSSFVPTAVGTYHWVATYSGDDNNMPAVEPNTSGELTAESVVIVKASPAINTVASKTATGILGSAILSDSATLSGGYNISGGSITFTLTQPDNTTISFAPINVTATGTYNSPVFAATELGTYTWYASYSGDGLNNGAVDNGNNESVTTSKANPKVVTTASFSSGNLVGSAIAQDSAALSNGYLESGTLTFNLIAPDNSVADTETVIVHGDGTYTTSNTHTATQVGTYTWVVNYSGDLLNNSAVDQGGTAEQVTTSPVTPSITSVPGNHPGGIIVLGSGGKLTDNADLEGAFSPTGTMTFKLYSPDNHLVDTESVPVNGNGHYTTPDGYVPQEAGTYQWVAIYSGDENNVSVAGGFGDEADVVAPAMPQINTIAGSTVVIGSGAKLSDSAMLSGGFGATGTITFTLYDSSNQSVYSEDVAISGDGTYNTAGGYLPTADGTYLWSASYSGDANNSGASDNGENENEVVLSPVTIGNFVWSDTNGNGIQNNGEAGISGVTLTLTGTDYSGATITDHATTNGAGLYLFTESPGTYTVSVEASNFAGGALAGYTSTATLQGNDTGLDSNPNNGGTTPAALPSGAADLSIDFGYFKPASIAGNVYYDTNNNGIFEGIESGISGATVTLTGTDGAGNAVSTSTTTDGSGAYSFANLQPGTYVLTETQPGGYLDGKDTIGTPGGTTTNDQFSAIALNAGVNGINNNFGEILPASLAGNVYYDANDNGIFNIGESGISGATVTLTGTDDLGNTVSTSTTTNGSGAYSFTNLRPGTYVLSETQPGGYLDGKDTIGTPGGTTSNDQFSAITLNAGVNGNANNFGEVLPASLAGNVYYDANDNGVFNIGESGISGATVTLTGIDDLGNSVSTSTTTNGSGAYAFTNLRPGTYVLSETQPASYLDGKDTIGTPGGTTSNDQFSAITLNAGVNGTANNFGEVLPASLAGNVYYDANDNGIFNIGESGISGATVTLTGTDDLGNSVSTSTTTNGSGAYSFTNLRPGSYTLSETQPAGYLDGKDTIGTPGGTTSNDQFSSVVLNAGVNGTANNFGEVLPASVSGFVYVDANNNGVKEIGEAPISNVTVALTGTDDNGNAVSLTTTTGVAGAYSFTNLRPGTYALSETQPSAYLDGKDTIGSQGGCTSNDQFSAVVLAAGTNGVNNNFGELNAASVSGFVYVDANNDGVKQTTETPIAGVSVTLTGTNDLGQPVTLTTTSAADGSYSFNNLRPGNYAVNETQPSAYLDGKDTIGSQGGVTGNDVFSSVVLASGTNGVNNNFGEVIPASVSGFVYVDANNDGIFQNTESPISGVTVTLTGTNDLGQTVTATTTTATNGSYSFSNLRPGTYSVAETQPAGFNDGKDTIGSLGGVTANDLFSQVVLTSGAAGTQYNFGEVAPPPTPTVLLGHGMTATIGFWHNKNGQALILSFNGGASSTQLGNWLATTFPHLYGPTTGANNMTGKTNTQVAAYFMTLFNVSGQKTAAQVLCNALALYGTSSTLAGGTMASSYGFIVNSNGTSVATYNVGSNGAAFGMANNTTLTVLQIVKAIDAQAVNGVLYGGNQTLINSANTVSNGINTSGDIT